MADVGDGKKWAAMQADWKALNQEARLERSRVTQAFQKAAVGKGSGPTTAQIELAETLEQSADDKRLKLDELLKKYFD